VYAAGDCAETFDVFGQHAVNAVIPTAVETGQVAALHMLGQPTRYNGSINANVLIVFVWVISSKPMWCKMAGWWRLNWGRADKLLHTSAACQASVGHPMLGSLRVAARSTLQLDARVSDTASMAWRRSAVGARR
jgi:hypothetical protein